MYAAYGRYPAYGGCVLGADWGWSLCDPASVPSIVSIVIHNGGTGAPTTRERYELYIHLRRPVLPHLLQPLRATRKRRVCTAVKWTVSASSHALNSAMDSEVAASSHALNSEMDLSAGHVMVYSKWISRFSPGSNLSCQTMLLVTLF